MTPFVGEIIAVGFNYAPPGWNLCDGSLLPIDQYQALFDSIGTTYGGDGVNTFGVPDMRGRMVIGYGQQQWGSYYAMGQKGGGMTQTLTVANIPNHTHPLNALPQWPINTDSAVSSSPTGNFLAPAQTNMYNTVSPAGSNYGSISTASSAFGTSPPMPIPVVDPYLVCNYIICLNGLFIPPPQ